MLKKLLLPLFALAILGASFISTPVFAASPFRPKDDSSCNLLGMTAWDCGVPEITSDNDLKSALPIIATNVLNTISVIASYLIIGYIIYGGYLYIFSGGDTGKLATGKKALNQAFIGLAITASATIIFNAIRYALLRTSKLSPEEAEAGANTILMNAFEWVIGIGGVIALIFVVGGGIMYITSAGDANKLQKGKNMILYSLIGLVIVALSFVITGFISGAINGS